MTSIKNLHFYPLPPASSSVITTQPPPPPPLWTKNDVIMAWPPRTFIFSDLCCFKIDINVITGDYRGEGVKKADFFLLRKIWKVPYSF